MSLGPIDSLQFHIHEVPDVFPQFLLDLIMEVLVLHLGDLVWEGEEGDPAGQVQCLTATLDRVISNVESSPCEVQSRYLYLLLPFDPAVIVLDSKGS